MADEKEQVKEGAQVVDEAAVEKKRRMLLIVIIAAIVLVQIPVMFVLISITRPKTPEEIAAVARADSLRAVVQMATIMGATTSDNPIEAIVNIAGTDNERYLKVTVLFEYDNRAHPRLGDELAIRGPRLKTILLEMLSKLTLMELNEPTSQERIRKEYLQLVNGVLPESAGRVSNVLLDEFIIQ